MKGLNLKKVGALVAGATILASSVAFAGLSFEDTELVNANGQPLVKVVVGADAAASDGVAAANIASYIANNAFATKTYTAMATDAECGSSATAGSTGTCAVTNEAVKLEVTVPGSVGTGKANFKLALNDYFDKDILNRLKSESTDLYALNTSEISTNANPFTDGNGLASAALSYTDLYKVSSGDFDALAVYTMEDEKASKEYTETQNIWLRGKTKLKTSSTAYVTDLDTLIYTIKFDGEDQHGIPYCTKITTGYDYTNCTDTSVMTKNHRVPIKFLGSTWVITDMTIPAASTQLISSKNAKTDNGGSVTLAKESKRSILNKGETLVSKDGQVKIRLDDISESVGATNEHPAIVTVLDANDQVVGDGQLQISPSSTEDVTVNGVTYTIRIYETAPGYTLLTTWADMALLEAELKLKDGEQIDTSWDIDWYVSLLWKNRFQNQDTSTSGQPDHLRQIILYTEDTTTDLDEGDSVDIVVDPAAWKLTYDGVDLAAEDYDTLKFALTDVTLKISDTCTYTDVPVLRIKSETQNAFDTGSYTSDTVYIAIANASTYTSTCSYEPQGYAFLKEAGASVYSMQGPTNNKYQSIKYTNAGEQGSLTQGGRIVWASNQTAMEAATTWTTTDTTSPGDMNYIMTQLNNTYGYGNMTGGTYLSAGVAQGNQLVLIVEDAGKLNQTDHSLDAMWFGIRNTTTATAQYLISSSFSFQGFTTATTTAGGTSGTAQTDDYIRYAAVEATIEPASGAKEEGKFATERGSKFISQSGSDVEFEIAKKQAKASYWLTTAGSTSTDESVTELTLAEGDEETVSGVTIKVVEITEDVGTCTVGAGTTPVCSVTTPATGYLVDGTGANVGTSVEASVKYPVSNMVILDSEADVETATLISVGGPAVNTVTAGVEEDLGLTEEGKTVVKKVGNVIVVAGYSAEDTVAAAEDFVAALQ